MGLKLENVIPWGRSLEEYVRMFNLTPEDLKLAILDCAGGPASFNAEMTGQGYNVISCDPVYHFTADEIADAPKPQSNGHDGRAEIQHVPVMFLRIAREQPHRKHHAQQTTVERHAAIPDLKQAEGIGQKTTEVIKQNVADSATQNDAHGAVKNQIADLLGGPTGIRTIGALFQQQKSSQKAQQIHDAVPADLERSECECDWTGR